MHRPLLFAIAALAAVCVLTACESDNAPTATPAQLAARVYVPPPKDIPGYKRTGDDTIYPSTLADQHKDPGMESRVISEGFRDGALAFYTPPKNTALRFVTLSFQAIIYNDANGAKAWYAEEAAHINRAPANGSIAPLVGTPANGVDDIVAYDSTQPSATVGAPPQRAFIALMRRGQVVIEIYGYASDGAVKPSEFTVYIAIEESLIQTPPQ